MQKDKEKLLFDLKNKGFSDDIIKAFAKIDREKFIPEHFTAYAYEDILIPLEEGSSLSQPSTIALVLKLLDLKQNQNILEIGSGSGYFLSLISEIIKIGNIYGFEINQKLAIKSKKILTHNSNIEIFNLSGINGFPEKAPFDRIIVSAKLEDKEIIINTLLNQLKDDGILILPVKDSIIKITKSQGSTLEEEYQGHSFAPFKL